MNATGATVAMSYIFQARKSRQGCALLRGVAAVLTKLYARNYALLSKHDARIDQSCVFEVILRFPVAVFGIIRKNSISYV